MTSISENAVSIDGEEYRKAEDTKRYDSKLGKFSPQFLQLIADLIAINFAYALHYYFRFETGFFEKTISYDFLEIIKTSLVLSMFWLAIFWSSGFYKNWYIRSPFDEFFKVVKVIFFGSFLIFFFVFLDSSQSPRMLFLAYFIIMSLSVGIGRLIARKLQKFLRLKRIIMLPVFIIGDYSKAKELSQKFNKSKAWGYKAIGFLSINNNETNNGYIDDEKEVPHLGNIKELGKILHTRVPAEIVLAVDTSNHSALLQIAAICSEKNIPLKILPDLYEIFTGQARTLPMYGIPLIEVNVILLKPLEKVAKRLLDIIFSSLVLVLGFPFWLITAILVKFDSPGPIFYQQVRVGKDGKQFAMYKFRSMVQDAEKHGPRWASVNDNRVTRFGRFLRKSHLDEIPQFWNVLKGDMSIVGPRPERPHFVEKFSQDIPYYKRRLLVKPGLTGWWQVNYTTYHESNEEITNRLKDDFYYIENMSLKLDIEIIIRTVFCVLKGHGQA